MQDNKPQSSGYWLLVTSFWFLVPGAWLEMKIRKNYSPAASSQRPVTSIFS